MSMLPILRTGLVLAVLGVMIASSLAAAGDGVRQGHWEYLGEDGAVWVPSERPTTAALPPADLGAYHTHGEMTAVLAALAAARPEVFTLTSLGTTVQGREIWHMRATGPGDAGTRPMVLYDGAHHGDEVIGSETLIRFLLRIDASYDDDPALRALLQEVVLDFVPMVNADGVALVPQCTHYAMCRKNARGVDLNRNYADHWGGAGSSGDPGSATYRGPAPLSEPESAALATLIDANDYALHASFHSGTELILWPHGWTTTAPPEETLYRTLGDELTALTGVTNGQTARILYSASGTTMDQAYGSAARWRPISFSPEAYVGSGNAFDWWLLFNPPETDAAIEPVAQRWYPLISHLAEVAPLFRPATLTVPAQVTIGPDVEDLVVAVDAAARRPFLAGSVSFMAGDAPVRVEGQNPVPLAAGSAPQQVVFPLLAERAGEHDVSITLDAGPLGTRSAEVGLSLVQVGLDLWLYRDSMGTPHDNTASVVVTAGPFDEVVGTVALHIGTRHLGTFDFEATQQSAAGVSVPFNASGLARGVHEVVAVATFEAHRDGAVQPGTARVSTTLTVQRPEVVAEKWFLPASPILQPLPVLSLYRNSGDMVAEDVVVTEVVPPGYAYWFRDGPVPVPTDPLGAPAPHRITPQADGSVHLSWDLGDLAPGTQKGMRYRVLPLVPGESVLGAEWSYTGDFGDARVSYAGAARPVHQAR